MLRRFTPSVRLLAAVAGMLLWGIAIASPVLADRDERGERGDRHEQGRGDRHEREDGDEDSLRCEGRQDFVRFEEKVCPSTPHRPVIIVKRVCCVNPAGKVHCRPFRQCPNRSVS